MASASGLLEPVLTKGKASKLAIPEPDTVFHQFHPGLRPLLFISPSF